jgi:hypothetical protein
MVRNAVATEYGEALEIGLPDYACSCFEGKAMI